MTDIVERLRETYPATYAFTELQHIGHEAADTIEALRQRVATLEDALTALVVAKDEKEFHGDTAVYQSLKKIAWNKARAAIRKGM